MFTAAIFMISLPVIVEPVKAILSTSRCWARAAPALRPSPLMKLTTPGGYNMVSKASYRDGGKPTKPASLIKLPRYKIERGVCSAAFSTTVFPVAREGPCHGLADLNNLESDRTYQVSMLPSPKESSKG